MSSGVFVLGMHRSGTSAATRLVNLSGVATCVAEDLAPVKPDNPRGHWESESLTELNDRILASLGCDWSCPPSLSPGWEANPALAELRPEAASRFEQVFPTDIWVWKDPRNCVTLPFWLRCLETDAVVVLVHRSPLEIAASLAVRDDFGTLYSLALWERYLRLCLEAVTGVPVLVASYSDLISDPFDWCNRMREFLEGVGISTTEPGRRDVLEFVDEGLRHTRFTPTDTEGDPALSEPQRELSLILEKLTGAHAALVLPPLGVETPSTGALLDERRHAYAMERRYDELETYARELAERFIVLEEATKAVDWTGDHAEFVPPGHYYSTIPDFVDVESRRVEIFERDPVDVAGIDLRLDDQIALLRDLLQLLPDVPFDDDSTEGLRYHFRNETFAQGDGLFLHLMLRSLRPRRVVEVGSGYSSACILDTVDLFLDACSCTLIDPYPVVLDSILLEGDRERVDMIVEPVQSVPVPVFTALDAGDLLFIDSTHVSKVGSDVNYLFFEVLPRLRRGVFVHVHDVFAGFEYPIAWMRERRAWTEIYLLRAFLQFNEAFEIVLWPSLLAATRPADFARFPKALENTGGSIYLRKTR